MVLFRHAPSVSSRKRDGDVDLDENAVLSLSLVVTIHPSYLLLLLYC